jgi:hypothetical protein
MEPLNYEIPPPNIAAGVGQGFGLGMSMQQAQQQQVAQALALQQAQRQQQVIGALLKNPNPTADDFAAATLAAPGLREQFKQAWDMHDGAQQKSALGEMGQVFAAVAGGQPEVASTLLNKRADALENSKGPPDQVRAARTLAQVVEAHPAFARTLIGMKLASIPGGDKVLANWSAMGKEQREQDAAPVDLETKKAEARIKAVAAGAAPAETDQKLRKGEEDITSAQAKRRIDDLNVQIAQANSETQRGQLTLERDKLVEKQGEKAQTEGKGAQDSLDTLEQALSTVRQVREHPGLAQVGDVRTKLVEVIPGSQLKDFGTLLETLKSQQFTAAISQMKGMGQLSDAEGKRLETAVSSLNTSMSPAAFKNALGVIEANLNKAQAKVVAGGKLPTAGGAFVMTHPTFGKVTDGDVNRLLAKYPGSTRDQVLQYLRTSGGK